VPALQRGGRIVYAGAGTSGRIAVQDGSELMPTFDWPADRVVFAVAGGFDALVRSVERAEDDEAAGAQAMVDAKVGADDVVIGIAASGTTPFTIGVLRAASAAGAVTIAVANNPDAPLFQVARHRILADTGSEVIAGSTRMKAGTAQRVALTVLSSLVMIRLGRVYHGQMVDLQAVNTKLVRRSENILMHLTAASRSEALQALREAQGNVKTALLLLEGCDLDGVMLIFPDYLQGIPVFVAMIADRVVAFCSWANAEPANAATTNNAMKRRRIWTSLLGVITDNLRLSEANRMRPRPHSGFTYCNSVTLTPLS